MMHARNILETANSIGSFGNLVKSFHEAGLEKMLKSRKALTVLAPTDRAFAKLPKRVYRRLMEDKKALREVLSLHVVPRKMMSADIAMMGCTSTIKGSKICVDPSNKERIENANIILPDIKCTNGVIHVIDSVLFPS